MKLITWNINSVRLRMPLLAKLTEDKKFLIDAIFYELYKLRKGKN